MNCSCGRGRFCKKCYSLCYYLLNRDKILSYQKDKYYLKKTPSGGVEIIKMPITIYFN